MELAVDGSQAASGRHASGTSVVLTGLKAASDLNGQCGTIAKWMGDKSRYKVHLQTGKTVAVKPANVRLQQQEFDTNVIVCESEERTKVVLAVAEKLGPCETQGPSSSVACMGMGPPMGERVRSR